MNRVVTILMDRDGYTKEEAKEVLARTREEMEDAIAEGDYSLAEDIMECDLGLELDYLMDVLF